MSIPPDRIVKFVRYPKLQQIEVRFSHYSQNAFLKHAHEAYSVGIIRQGQTCFTQYGPPKRQIQVGRNDIVLINPGEVHACNPLPNCVLTYYMLYIDPDLMQEVLNPILFSQAGSFSFHAPLVQDPVLFKGLSRLCAVLFQQTSRLEIESSLFELLTELALQYGIVQVQAAEPSTTTHLLQKSRQYLMDHLTQEVHLQELADLCRVSPYYFLRTFRNTFGLPPHSYQLQQRINLAKRLLAKGKSIAEVALEAGFADQSHFTRKFKTLVGATPHQYQQTT